MTSLPVFALAGILLSTPLAAQPDPLEEGYAEMYNLEFDAAHHSFREWEQAHPDDPMGPVSEAAAYLFTEFDRMHILQSEFFSHDREFLSRRPVAPDPVLKQHFESALEQSRALAARTLQRAPQDKNAIFASILRLGLHSDYLALVEKRYLSSLSEMREGRLLAEKLLAADPGYYDAYLAIGIENYLLSLKPAPVRWFLRIGGAQIDKAQGLAKLRLTAANGHYLRPFARLLLAVAAIRDNQHARAKDLLKGLAADYPRNPLFAREVARLN
jgi:hypothetical protein